MSDADIEILIEEDKPLEPEIKQEIDPVEGLEKLKADLAKSNAERETERNARIAAERRASEAGQEVSKARNEVQDSNLSLVTNAIETVKQTQQILKERFRDAMANADYETVADLNIQISDTSAKLNQLETGKNQLEEQTKRKPEPQVQQRQLDPLEDLASRVTARSAAWLREHPECARDQKIMRKMFRAHEDAIDDGIEPDTDNYFNFIENRLGYKLPGEQALAHEEGDKPIRRVSPAAAPVSRQASTNGQTRPNVVRLSAEQREMAEMMGQTAEEYAKNLLALKTEGKIQ